MSRILLPPQMSLVCITPTCLIGNGARQVLSPKSLTAANEELGLGPREGRLDGRGIDSREDILPAVEAWVIDALSSTA